MKIVKFGQILKRGNTLDFSGGSLANCHVGIEKISQLLEHQNSVALMLWFLIFLLYYLSHSLIILTQVVHHYKEHLLVHTRCQLSIFCRLRSHDDGMVLI